MKLKIIFLVLLVLVAVTGWFIATSPEGATTTRSTRSSNSSSDDPFKNF